MSQYNIPPFTVILAAVVNEAGLDNGGSQAGTTQEYGVLTGVPSGWSIVSPGDTSVAYGDVVQHAGAWKFQLTTAVEHSGGNAGTMITPDDKATVILRDAAGILYEVPLSVSIVDDVARISGSASLKVASGGSVNGTLTARYGADGMAADDPLTVAGAAPVAIDGDMATYALEYGTLVLNTATGKYTFTGGGVPAGMDSAQQAVTFVARDGDGDTASRAVTITVSKPAAPQFSLFTTVGEAGLDGAGSMGDTDFEYGAIMGLPDGWTVVGGGSDDVAYGGIVNHNGAWMFQLTQSLTHDDGEGPNVRIPADKPTVTIQDAFGNQYEVRLAVSVVDDMPEIYSIAEEYIDISEGFGSPLSVEGQLEFIFGADGAAQTDALAWDIASLAGLTSNGKAVSFSQADGALTASADGQAVFTLSLAQDGTYIYTQHQILDGVSMLEFGLQVKDGDNDITTMDQALTIYIEGELPPPFALSTTVYENGLDEGGSWSVTDLEYGAIAGLPAGWTIVGAGSESVDYGSLAVFGGEWKFALTQALRHPDGGENNALIPDEKPTVIVQDAQGNQVEVVLEVTVMDDVPEMYSYFTEEYIDISDGFATPVTVSGQMDFVFGADGPAANDALTWDTAALPALTSNGHAVTFSQDDGVLTGTADGITVFTLSLAHDGEYTYAQYRHLDDADMLQFGLTLKDSDNDPIFIDEAFTVYIEGTPPFELPELAASVSEAGLADGSSAATDLEFGAIIGLPADWSIVGPGSATVDYGRMVNTGQGWQFQLTGALAHPDGDGANLLTPADKPTVLVQDSDGNQHEIEVTVTVTDDVPEFIAPGTNSVDISNGFNTPLSASGSLDFTFGADGAAATDAMAWNTDALTGLTSNGRNITFSQNNGTLTGVAGSETVFSLALGMNGAYQYTQFQHLDGTANLAFGLTLKDLDGDVANEHNALIISIAGELPPVGSGGQDDRLVMMTGSNRDNINGKASLVDVLLNDGDPNATLLSVTSGIYGDALVNADGSIRYTLRSDAADLMGNGGTSTMYDFLTYTARGSNGVEYSNTVEARIIRQNAGTNLYTSDNTVDGEKIQAYVPYTGDGSDATVEIAGSDGGDVLRSATLTKMAIDLKGGNNTVSINHNTDGLITSKLIMGGDDDVIEINTSGRSVFESTIDMGSGCNKLLINGLNSTKHSVDGSSITLSGIESNTIKIHKQGGSGYAIHDSVISTSTGNDEIEITTGSGIYALVNAKIYTKDGDDTVIINSNAGVIASRIELGSGNDKLFINATDGSALVSKNHNVVDAGSGDDLIFISGNGALTNANMNNHPAGSNTVYGGSGNDTLIIDGLISTYFVNARTKNNIDGGLFDEDRLWIKLDAGTVAQVNTLRGMASKATVTNFEKTILDLTGTAKNTLTLSQDLMGTIQKFGWETAGGVGEGTYSDIYIKGDDGDTVIAKATGITWTQAGTETYDGDLYNIWADNYGHTVHVTDDVTFTV